jgi:DNA polymerase III alpha subunit (gram-positive type)
VVHSKGADLNYLYHLEEHYNLPKLYSKWADTNEIARSLGRCENLPDLYSQLFDVPFTEHHKALDDARACGLIFEQLSSQVNIRQFIHEENYLPTDKKREYDATNTRHTQYGTATVAPDGLVFNYDKILNKSFFKDKKVALSGMSVIDNNRIKSILTDSLGAKCTSKPSGKTDVFIINQNNVGPSKRIDAIRFQQTTGLLIITDDYFWELI